MCNLYTKIALRLGIMLLVHRRRTIDGLDLVILALNLGLLASEIACRLVVMQVTCIVQQEMMLIAAWAPCMMSQVAS